VIPDQSPVEQLAMSRGKVIMFRPRGQKPAPKQSGTVVSQDRLRRLMDLQMEEARVVREVREQMLALQADIAAGASVEEGSLTFDCDIRTVKRAPTRMKNR
jgi:hypothetical protein